MGTLVNEGRKYIICKRDKDGILYTIGNSYSSHKGSKQWFVCNHVILLNKEELESVQHRLKKDRVLAKDSSLKCNDYFVLNINSKSFKKLYDLKCDTCDDYSDRLEVKLIEKYKHDILILKVISSLKHIQKKHS